LPEIEGEKSTKTYPIGFFHIDIAELRTEEGKLHLHPHQPHDEGRVRAAA
jgi:hypothetical protein